MDKFLISGTVKRFKGNYGWYYVELEESLSQNFRPMIKNIWPKLLRASFKIQNTKWNSSIMPIKNGPLFIALPQKIRKAEAIQEGQVVNIEFELIL